MQAHFSAGTAGTTKTYQTDYLLDPQTIAPGATGSANMRLFAGAKEVQTIDAYDKALSLNRFDLLIDWGWFYFITKPMFKAIDYFYHAGRQFRHRDPDRHRAGEARCSSRSPTSPTPRWRR